MCHAGDELADGGEFFALHELRFDRLLLRHILDHHHGALLGGGAGNAGGVHANRPVQALGARDQRGRALAAARSRQELVQHAGVAEQRLAEPRADDVLERHAQEARQRAIGAPHVALIVNDGNAFAERVERRLPLLLGAAHHLEEARVRDDDGRVRRECRQQANVLGDEYAFSGVGDDQGADHSPVRAQGHRRGRGRLESFRNQRRDRPRAGVAHQLEVLVPGGPPDQTRVSALNPLPAQGRERALGGRYLERVLGRLTEQREQRALRVEEPHRIAHHLRDDVIELQRVGQDVRQLLQRKQFGQPAIQLLRGAAPLQLGLHQTLPQTPQRDADDHQRQRDAGSRVGEWILSQQDVHGHLYSPLHLENQSFPLRDPFGERGRCGPDLPH